MVTNTQINIGDDWKTFWSAVSAGDRGVTVGGYSSSGYDVTIDYITISTTGNATDFGDLSATRAYFSATSNSTNERGVFGGGTTGVGVDIIEYVTINSIGNATDFGDLTVSRSQSAGCSDA